MQNYRLVFVFLGIALVSFGLFGIAKLANQALGHPRSLDDAAVKITLAVEGHGSGVLLDHGVVLTAAHVVKPESLPAKVEHGGQSFEAEVLWRNDGYDIALLAVKGELAARHRQLTCRTLRIGEPVTISGFPLEFPAPVTTRGIVSALPTSHPEWREYVLTDAVVNKGASGSGVLDVYGEVIGVFVGFFGTHLQTPFLYHFDQNGHNAFVPGSTVCRLLGRA